MGGEVAVVRWDKSSGKKTRQNSSKQIKSLNYTYKCKEGTNERGCLG